MMGAMSATRLMWAIHLTCGPMSANWSMSCSDLESDV